MPQVDAKTEASAGVHGAVPPANARRATLTINASHNHWYVRDPWHWGNQVFADGTGPGVVNANGNYPYPPRPFALIGAWFSPASNQRLGWFVVSDGLVTDIPKNNPQDWRIVYACNDDAYRDNGGMIEVFETFT